MNRLFSLWNSTRQYLIPYVEENLGPLSAKESEFVRAAELAKAYRWNGCGRRPKNRKAVLLAFIAKAVWNLLTTRALIGFLGAGRTARTLCGWERAVDAPSESTFSRAFERFAMDKVADRLHGAMVAAALEGRLAGHASMDSTEVEAKEKAAAKPKKEKGQKPMGGRKRGKGQPTRLELQAGRTLEENLADLPCVCDHGRKRNSRGFSNAWKGYKLHMAAADAPRGEGPAQRARRGGAGVLQPEGRLQRARREGEGHGEGDGAPGRVSRGVP
jgi:hypothetical protein